MIWIAMGVVGLPLAALVVLWLIGERGQVLGLPSTRAALRGNEDAKPRQLNFDAVHAYVYGRWTPQYIGFVRDVWLPRMGPKTKQHWADHYHGKVLPLELAQAVITLDHDIVRCDLEQIIPYPLARDIVLRSPTEITAYECGCRLSRAEHCEPTQVCMIVGDGSFVLDHHPDRSRRLTQQEALDLLHAEHERGHVHTAYFKDVCGGQFYAICNCCPCCCGGIEAMVKYSVPMVASSGYVSQVDEALCSGCGECETACPFAAISFDGMAHVTWEKCMGCGVCVDRCTSGALSLALDARKGIPMDVRKIGIPVTMG